ncbi:MAG: hypothetical protein ACO4CZ_17540, partial [Planctomycetota bacterium]
MPLRYGSDLAEHRAVRTAAGLFDVAHMGQSELRGPDAARALERVLVSRVATLAPGRARYTMCCDADGTVVADLIVARLPEDAGDWIVANARCASSRFRGAASSRATRRATAAKARPAPGRTDPTESITDCRRTIRSRSISIDRIRPRAERLSGSPAPAGSTHIAANASGSALTAMRASRSSPRIASRRSRGASFAIDCSSRPAVAHASRMRRAARARSRSPSEPPASAASSPAAASDSCLRAASVTAGSFRIARSSNAAGIVNSSASHAATVSGSSGDEASSASSAVMRAAVAS